MSQQRYEVSLHQPVALLVQQLQEELKRRNVPVFAIIDHAKNAKEVGLTMRDTTLMIFGNPLFGTNLMLKNQRIAYDLPLRLLLWEDEMGVTWISYESPKEMAEPYGLGHDPIILNMQLFMKDVIQHVILQEQKEDAMLTEGTTIYFLVNGYVMSGVIQNIQGTPQEYTFEIEGYGGCGGPHIMNSHQIHHTIFTTKEEAEANKDNEAMFLSGHC